MEQRLCIFSLILLAFGSGTSSFLCSYKIIGLLEKIIVCGAFTWIMVAGLPKPVFNV